MANAQKYTRAACGHLAAHYERRKDEKGEYVKFGNQDIDPQKTHLNYNLCPRRGLEQIDFIRQRTTEARTLKRDDVNVMCSWVVTLPEYRHHNQNLHVSPDKEQVERLFFERTYQFLCDRYGEQNVIVQLRKENQTLKTENNTLRSKVADLEAMVHRLGQIIREKLPGSMLLSRSQSVIGSSHRRSRSPNQGIWNAKKAVLGYTGGDDGTGNASFLFRRRRRNSPKSKSRA